MIKTKNLFITGKPGSGKTTLIKEVCRDKSSRFGGFFTEELREGNSRSGFVIRTIDGKHGIFAKKGMKSKYKLDKYGLDLNMLHDIGIQSINNAIEEDKIIVIDEIGSMEIMSEEFRKILIECLNSQNKILATIRHNSQPFTDKIKKMENASLLYLSRQNYPEVKQEILEWIST